MKVIHDNNMFLLKKNNDQIGYLIYSKEANILRIEKIYVTNDYRGKGLARVLLDEFILYVKNNNLKIIPICSYAKKVFNKEKELQYLMCN